MQTEGKPPLDPDQEHAYPSPFKAWYTVGVLTFVYMFSFVDRQILNLLVRPIRRDMEISDTQMSLLMGLSFAAFYAVFGIPLGRLADQYSRRTIIAVGFSLWSFLTAACGLATQYWQLLLLRMGVGVGEASLSPAAYSMISDNFPVQRRGLALGIYSMGIYMGSGLALVLGGAVAALAAQEEMWNLPIVGETRPWQLVFFLVGLPGIILALLMFTVPEPLRRSRLPSGGVAVVRANPSITEVIRYMLANWQTILCHNVGFGLLSFSSYAASAWIPTFFVRIHDWPESRAGFTYGIIVAVFGMLGVSCGGWFVDVLSKRGYRDSAMRVGIIVGILWAPFGMSYPLIANVNLAVAMLAISIFFASAPFGAAVAAIQQAFPPPMRGQASAIYLFNLNLVGLGAGPLAVALVTDFYFKDDNMVHYSLLIISTIAHAGSALLLWVGLGYFLRSLDRLKEWTAANA